MSRNNRDFERLVEIMRTLRGPEGCPWDREQDLETLKPYLIEEAYEALEAIDNADYDELKDELGDVLLQVVFQAQVASEMGCFDVSDVINAIADKLVRRHPHVFQDTRLENAEQVVRQWASIKREEKPERGERSILDGVPASMPALLRAHRLTEKASRVGFDWPAPEEVFKKMTEETEELAEAVSAGAREGITEEIGDLLFTLTNLARLCRVNPEEALRGANAKFVRRFQRLEARAAEAGVDLAEVSLAQMDAWWEEAKAGE